VLDYMGRRINQYEAGVLGILRLLVVCDQRSVHRLSTVLGSFMPFATGSCMRGPRLSVLLYKTVLKRGDLAFSLLTERQQDVQH
jgi:hypothetical protein